jgi:hypothetical protein
LLLFRLFRPQNYTQYTENLEKCPFPNTDLFQIKNSYLSPIALTIIGIQTSPKPNRRIPNPMPRRSNRRLAHSQIIDFQMLLTDAGGVGYRHSR